MPQSNVHSSPTAIVVSIRSASHREAEVNHSLRELEHLLGGLGIRVAGTLAQRRSEPRAPLVLGSGKLDELRTMIAAMPEGPPLLVFDDSLSPGQEGRLARELGVEVVDRTQIILRVFEQRARTRAARLEIEIARLEYETPRLRDDLTIGSKQGGGGGRGEKGHTSVEIRKQQLRKRIATLRSELERATGKRLDRQRRRDQVSSVALVGYTNAGKSSWMRALTGAEVLVQDALFVTLDTTVRQLHPPAPRSIVVADTVGFLRNLPNELLASFQSTLAEALDAELLLIVLDGSDADWRTHLDTTRQVLERVGANEIPSILLVNKCDRLSELERAALAQELDGCLCVSAREPKDVRCVRDRLVRYFEHIEPDIAALTQRVGNRAELDSLEGPSSGSTR